MMDKIPLFASFVTFLAQAKKVKKTKENNFKHMKKTNRFYCNIKSSRLILTKIQNTV